MLRVFGGLISDMKQNPSEPDPPGTAGCGTTGRRAQVDIGV